MVNCSVVELSGQEKGLARADDFHKKQLYERLDLYIRAQTNIRISGDYSNTIIFVYSNTQF